MARLIIASDNHTEVLMDECVKPCHLQDCHASLQILERLAWAVDKADLQDEAMHITALAAMAPPPH